MLIFNRLFQAQMNMVMLQSEDIMKAAMAHLMKSKEQPPFAKLWNYPYPYLPS